MDDATQPGTTFVGRTRELAALRTALAHAMVGHGRLALLTGEPGIGKTRTATEFAAHAGRAGARVLWGACYDGEWAPPFGPFAEAIAAYMRDVEPEGLRDDLGFGAGAIARVVPAVRERLPALPEALALPPDEERFRLVDAVSQFLVALARRDPLVLVLEDLHWADRSTIAMLRHLARFAPPHRLLLLGTYRDGEVDVPHPLAEALGALYRETTCERILLTGLAATEVAQLVADEALPASEQALVRAIHAATDGNPFFVCEVLRHLREDGLPPRAADAVAIAIPDSVRQVLARRVDRLAPETGRLLSVAAAFGAPFHLGIAARVAALGDEAALAALDAALHARLVRPADGAERYDFAHAIVRETLYAELSPSRRQRLHRQLAEAMEEWWANRLPDHAAEIAQQYFRGRALPGAERGVAHAVAAADRAAGAYARDDEAAFLRIAVDLLAEDAPRRPALLARLGRALAWTADGATAAETAAEAARRIATADGPAAAADYVASVLPALYEQGFLDAAFALARQGLRYCGDRRDVTWASIRAMDILRIEAEDASGVGITLDTPERREVAQYCGERIIAPEYLRGFFILPSRAAIDATYPAGRRDERFGEVLLGEYRRGAVIHRERAQRHEREGRIAKAAAYWFGTFRMLTALGEFAEATEARERCLALASRLPGPSAITVYVESGEDQWRSARDEGWDEPTVGVPARDGGTVATINRAVVWAAIARIHSRMGREERALRRLESVIPAIERAPVWAANYTYTKLVCDAAETLWFTRRRAHARTIERNLREKVLPADFREPMTDWRSALARLCALQVRHDEASDWFAAARSVLDEQGARPLRAVVDYDEGLMLVRRGAAGDRERALPLLEAALRQFRAIGMPGWIRRAESVLCDGREWAPGAQAAGERPPAVGQARDAPATGTPEPPRSASAADEDGETTSRFHKSGDYWTIAHRGTVVTLRDGKGLGYLAQLLRHAGQEILALELAQGRAGADHAHTDPAAGARTGARADTSAPILDAAAKASYRRRLEELREELGEAEQNHDIGRSDRIRAEIDMLASELRAALGLGGRDRRAAGDLERARSAVGKRIRAEIRRIGNLHPSLGRHLLATITTGYFCCYHPEYDDVVGWLL